MAYGIPDHPVIRNLERTGYPDGREPEYPHCPVCGRECFEIYVHDGDIEGCDECVERKDLSEADPANCPVCEGPADTVYIRNGQTVGCTECIAVKDAWQTEKCFG